MPADNYVTFDENGLPRLLSAYEMQKAENDAVERAMELRAAEHDAFISSPYRASREDRSGYDYYQAPESVSPAFAPEPLGPQPLL